MGMYKKIDNNTLQKLAGYTVVADGSCAEIRKGYIAMAPDSSSPRSFIGTATFTTPMPDTDYDVIINYDNVPSGQAETTGGQIIKNKTVNGFIYQLYNSVNTSGSFNMGYTAIKLITMEGYTEIQNKVNNPDSTPTPNSLNLCTSGGIYDAIQNASSVFVGTRSEWLDEPDKTSFDIAVLTDAPQNINAVDSSTGDLTVVADKTNIWKGTLAQWEALTPSEKDLYEQAEIDDGISVSTSLLQKIYPVGSVYINTVDVNPSTIFGFGTWQRIASNMALWGASADGQAGTTKAAGLPNITGNFACDGNTSNGAGVIYTSDGAFQSSAAPQANIARYTPTSSGAVSTNITNFNASRSNPIFGASTTVQPPALVINVWKRTA